MRLLVPKAVAIHAVHRLAAADYDVATRLSDATATVVDWSLTHDYYWLADAALDALRACDAIGSIWIALVCWLVAHTH